MPSYTATAKYLHKQTFAMNSEELEMFALRKDAMYKKTMATIVKVMNDPGHNINKKLSVKDQLISRLSK